MLKVYGVMKTSAQFFLHIHTSFVHMSQCMLCVCFFRNFCLTKLYRKFIFHSVFLLILSFRVWKIYGSMGFIFFFSDWNFRFFVLFIYSWIYSSTLTPITSVMMNNKYVCTVDIFSGLGRWMDTYMRTDKMELNFKGVLITYVHPHICIYIIQIVIVSGKMKFSKRDGNW